jgi:hypothetical protein
MRMPEDSPTPKRVSLAATPQLPPSLSLPHSTDGTPGGSATPAGVPTPIALAGLTATALATSLRRDSHASTALPPTTRVDNDDTGSNGTMGYIRFDATPTTGGIATPADLRLPPGTLAGAALRVVSQLQSSAANNSVARSSGATRGPHFTPGDARLITALAFRQYAMTQRQAPPLIPRSFQYGPCTKAEAAAQLLVSQQNTTTAANKPRRMKPAAQAAAAAASGEDFLVPSEMAPLTLRGLREAMKGRWDDVIGMARFAELRGVPLTIDPRRLLLSSTVRDLLPPELREAIMKGASPPKAAAASALKALPAKVTASLARGSATRSVRAKQASAVESVSGRVAGVSVSGVGGGAGHGSSVAVTPAAPVKRPLVHRGVAFADEVVRDRVPAFGTSTTMDAVSGAGGFLLEGDGHQPLTLAEAQPTADAAIRCGHLHPFEKLYTPTVVHRDPSVVNRHDGTISFVTFVLAWISGITGDAVDESLLDSTAAPAYSRLLPDPLLACVAVDFRTFVLLFGDYTTQHAVHVPAEPYDPRLKDKIRALQTSSKYTAAMTGGGGAGRRRDSAATRGSIEGGSATEVQLLTGTTTNNASSATQPAPTAGKTTKPRTASRAHIGSARADGKRALLLKRAPGARFTVERARMAQEQEEAEIRELEAALEAAQCRSPRSLL